MWFCNKKIYKRVVEYSREEIVKYFYETKRKLGRVPKVKEFKLISPVRRNWGKLQSKEERKRHSVGEDGKVVRG